MDYYCTIPPPLSSKPRSLLPLPPCSRRRRYLQNRRTGAATRHQNYCPFGKSPSKKGMNMNHYLSTPRRSGPTPFSLVVRMS